MADIHIIYAREDQDVARELYNLLSQRWEVWWDEDLVGDFAKVIESEITKSGCVVPLYSSYFRTKPTCTDELRIAVKNNKKILPIRLDDNEPPYSFGNHSYVDMFDWAGEVDHSGFKLLQRKLTNVVPPRSAPVRPSTICAKKISLPEVFLSVSSHETQLIPVEAVRALRVFGVPKILISAYDLVLRRKPKEIIEELNLFRESGGSVLVDSGYYEKSRLGSGHFTQKDFQEALGGFSHDWVFCFDEAKPSKDKNRAVDEIVAAVTRDQALTDAPVFPIIHAPALKAGGHKLDDIPWIVREVANRLQPSLIALPERELGAGLIARAKTVKAIRAELNQLPFYQSLHLLGTGNPWSIPVFVAAGADTFDGLEWCRMAIDRETDRLHHFQHFDFFKYQTEWADSAVAREALKDSNVDFAGKVAFHNLDYYTNFMKEMKKHIGRNSMEAFVVGVIGRAATNQLIREIPGLFYE